MAQSLVVSQEEMDKQRQCAARVREGFPGRTYKIVTYGCQMNVADSEVIASVMQMAGYSVAETLEEADAVFMNLATSCYIPIISGYK